MIPKLIGAFRREGKEKGRQVGVCSGDYGLCASTLRGRCLVSPIPCATWYGKRARGQSGRNKRKLWDDARSWWSRVTGYLDAKHDQHGRRLAFSCSSCELEFQIWGLQKETYVAWERHISLEERIWDVKNNHKDFKLCSCWYIELREHT